MKFEMGSALWTFLVLFNFQKVTHLAGGNITFFTVWHLPPPPAATTATTAAALPQAAAGPNVIKLFTPVIYEFS
jgi:hypothetical protein